VSLDCLIGFILSSFCALCLVLLVSLDCLIRFFFVVVMCLVSSVAGVFGLPHQVFFRRSVPCV